MKLKFISVVLHELVWPPDGATCIDYKFGHPTAATFIGYRCHHLHWLPIWPPDGTTCTSYKAGHQMASLALFPYLTTRCHYLYWFQI